MRTTPRIGCMDAHALRSPTPEDRYLQDLDVLGSRETTWVESAPVTREHTYQAHNVAMQTITEPAPSPRNKIPKNSPRGAERCVVNATGGDGTPAKGMVTSVNGTPMVTEASLRRILREELSVALAAHALAPGAAAEKSEKPPEPDITFKTSRSVPRKKAPRVCEADEGRALTATPRSPSDKTKFDKDKTLHTLVTTGSGMAISAAADTKDPLSDFMSNEIQTSRSKIEIESLPLYDRWPPWVRDSIDWWLHIREPERTGQVAQFVDGHIFSVVCTVVILLNSLFIIWDTNFEMHQSIMKGSVDDRADLNALERCFLVFYTVELVVKIFVHRIYLFIAPGCAWNWFDFTLVFFGMIGLMLEGQQDVVHYTFIRIMRLAKVTKILRAVRLMRLLEPLRLILSCLLHSVSSLFWSIVMMVLFFFLFSTVFVQLAAGYLQSHWTTVDPLLVQELETTFGSVQAAMLSLYQASTGGNDWAVFYLSLTQTGVMNSAAYLFFVAFTQVALLNIITGLFIESALKHAAPNAESKALQNRVEQLDEIEMLSKLFTLMDSNKDGTVSMDEFDEALEVAKIRHTLAVMGLDTFDARNLFCMMQEVNHYKEDELTLESFIHACMRLRGAASSRDTQVLLFRVKELSLGMQEFRQRFSDIELVLSGDQLEVDLDKSPSALVV